MSHPFFIDTCAFFPYHKMLTGMQVMMLTFACTDVVCSPPFPQTAVHWLLLKPSHVRVAAQPIPGRMNTEKRLMKSFDLEWSL